MSVLVNVLLVFLFVLIGGVFAATELALVSLRESQIRALERGGKSAQTVANLAKDSGRFLSAVQIGVTFAGFFSSAFGASTIAPALDPVLVDAGVPQDVAGLVALVAMTIVISYLSLVFGELVPKRIAMQKAEQLSLIVAPPLNLFAKLMTPVIWIVNSSSNLILRLIGLDPDARGEEMSNEEVRDIVTSHTGFDEGEKNLMTDVFHAGDRVVEEVMRHRRDIVGFPTSLSIAEVASAVRSEPYSRFPLYAESIDAVDGFVHVRDLFESMAAGRGADRVSTLMRDIPMFPSTLRLPAALREMREHSHHIAIVVDEYGGTDGLITLEDLIEELVGEIWDEYDREEQAAATQMQISTNFNGTMNIEDFAEESGVVLPEGPYETVAGWLILQLGRIPTAGDRVSVPSEATVDLADDAADASIAYAIEVVEMEGNRIATITLLRVDASVATSTPEPAPTDGQVEGSAAVRPDTSGPR